MIWIELKIWLILVEDREALQDIIYPHCLNGKSRLIQLIDWFSVRPSTVKTTDITPLSVSPWVSSVLLTLSSTMGHQGGKPGVLAGDMSLEQGGREPFLIPALFSGRLTLLNRHRVNQHISLYPSRSSIGQYSQHLCVCLLMHYGMPGSTSGKFSKQNERANIEWQFKDFNLNNITGEMSWGC